MSLLREVWGEQSEPKDSAKPDSICVHIRDENVKRLLKPYKTQYLSEMTEKALLQLLEPSRQKSVIESFNCDSEQVTIFVLIIAGLLLLQITLHSRR